MITTYTETNTDLKVNKIDRETFDLLSAQQISPQELWFITSADSVVVDIDKIGVSRDWTPEISALSSEIDDVENQIQGLDLSAIQQELSSMEDLADYFESLSAVADLSAVEQLVDGKRDYDDLTYNITTPAEALDISKFSDPWDIDATYAAKLTFTLSGNVNPITLTYDNSRWYNDNYAVPDVGFAQFYGLDPSDGMFVLYGNVEGSIIQFDLEDGTNTQVFNFTSQEYPDFTTLTMTFNGDSGHTISDNLALESQLSAYVPTSQFDLSGLGCATLNLSGTYEDESTFSYDFVVKEANQ